MGMSNRQFDAFLRVQLGWLNAGIKEAEKTGSFEELEKLINAVEEALKRP